MKRLLVLALSAGLIGISTVGAVTVGQVDTFQDNTTDSWANGGTQPVVVNGGPGGASDLFLQLNADGSASNGRLTVFNRNQWLGNYIAAGVNEIDLDLRNFSSVTLSIRLAFKSSTAAGAPGYVSTTAFTLAPNSGWQHAIFMITPATMTALGGPAAFNTFFASPAEFRIVNSASPSLTGDNVTAQLGIDNIVAVPEPNITALLIIAALACSCGIVRRWRAPVSLPD